MIFKIKEILVPIIVREAITSNSTTNVITSSDPNTKSNQTVTGEQKLNNKVLEPRQTKKGIGIPSTSTSNNSNAKEVSKVRKKLEWSFNVAPDQISWSRNAELKVSETFMTNEQPVIYGLAGMAELTFSSVLFDARHRKEKGNLQVELTNLNSLLEVDEANFSPRVYSLFAEDRLYGNFVVKSLKISELFRDAKGNPTRIVAEIVWQTVPKYQIRTSNDLAMPAEILPDIKIDVFGNSTDSTGNGQSTGTLGGCLVDAGTVLGKVGNTGNVKGVNGSGGHHVHLEKTVNGVKVDPLADSGYFLINNRPLAEFVNPKTNTSTSHFNAKRPSSTHEGQDYGQGISGGETISLATSASLLLASYQSGWGNYIELEINGAKFLIAHMESIEKDKFKCDAANKSSSNSGNTGGNVPAK